MIKLNILRKIVLLTVIIGISSISILVYVDSAYAICLIDENGNRIEPCRGLPIPTFSLKDQVNDNKPKQNINCPDNNHILIERPNRELACVYPYTMVKQQWSLVDDSFWSLVIKNEQQYGVFTHLSETQNIENLKYNQDKNSIIIQVISDKPETLSVNINRELLDLNTESCRPTPGDRNYFVLINGVEVVYDMRNITDNYKYLEIYIDTERINELLDRTMNAHKMHDWQYEEDSKIIEIIGTCLI